MPTRLTPDMILLSKAMDATKLSARQFAKFIVRDVRNVYRWTKGETGLPAAVRERCHQIVHQAPSALEAEVNAWIIKEFKSRHESRRARR